MQIGSDSADYFRMGVRPNIWRIWVQSKVKDIHSKNDEGTERNKLKAKLYGMNSQMDALAERISILPREVSARDDGFLKTHTFFSSNSGSQSVTNGAQADEVDELISKAANTVFIFEFEAYPEPKTFINHGNDPFAF